MGPWQECAEHLCLSVLLSIFHFPISSTVLISLTLAWLAVMLYYIPAYSFMSSVMDICLWLIWATLLIPDVHNRGHSGVPMISHVFGWPLLGSKSQKKWNCKILFSSVLSRICGSVKGQKTVLYYICTFKFNHNTGHISLHFLSFICLVVSQSNI